MAKEEREDLQKRADLAGLTASELIRQSVKKVRHWTPEDKETALLNIRAVASIGNNVNQNIGFCGNLIMSPT